ncbi:MAG: phospholipase D family protein [archaeon]|nr:phospholipase D family protein [archaeon]
MLYSYTPFKLRGTGGNYSILLLPSIRGHNITTKWCDDDARTFYEGDTKILTPNSIRLTSVSDLKSMVSVNGERGFRLEIDRRSPTSTYYCKMGLFVSPSSSCNRRECYLWDPCQGKRFWKGPKSFYSLGKVSPNIAVKIDRYDQPTTIQSNKFGLSVETIENLQAKIYIDSVVFFSSYFNHSPMITLKETPGYRITTRGVAFSIEASWIQKFVETVLSNDPEIFAWIFTKYFVSSNYDVNDLRRVSTFFWNIISAKKDTKVSEYEKKIKARSLIPELVQFGVSVLMHSLAHLIHEEVISMLQTSPENLIYSYSKKPETDGRYRVFIIENAERGLGLTQSFAAFVNRLGAGYLDDLANRINKILAICNRNTLSFSPSTGASRDVKLIWDHVSDYNRIFQLKFGISAPVEFVRYILSRYDSATSKVIEKDEVSPYVDDILSATPLCWDGCYHCVRLEADCHDSPYEQIFDVSKSLLTAFLNEWRGTFKVDAETSSKTKTIVQIGEAKNLLNYIRKAKNRVIIISPWFSKEVARTICELAKSRALKFRILTSDDKSNETHVEALRIFSAEQNQGVQVKVLTDRLPHVKMIVVDDSLLIMGSANLTLSGLYENVEGYIIIDDTDAITKSIYSFEEFWNQGKDITETR